MRRRWGDIFPGWVPNLGGSRVPPLLAIVPASIAAILLTTGGFAIWHSSLTSEAL
jgi:hypothetical protein